MLPTQRLQLNGAIQLATLTSQSEKLAATATESQASLMDTKEKESRGFEPKCCLAMNRKTTTPENAIFIVKIAFSAM
jgi:hypothetical protein